jgi:fatty-acyl-CoA synthase
MKARGASDAESEVIVRRTEATFRPGDFPTLTDALDHAATGSHGMTFFDGHGEPYCDLGYRLLRERAVATARRLVALGAERGDRIAIVAETRPEFVILFFACQYAGLVPVPMPATVSLGGRDHYLSQLHFLVRNARARAAFATPDFIDLLREAVDDASLEFVGTLDELDVREMSSQPLVPSTPDEIAYVQYTSGSTRVARGAVITQRAVMINLRAIIDHGIALTPQDRFFSWLPFYHDMGLVGKLLVPVAGQAPVAYLGTREFAMRPRLWLALVERTRATISFGPPFGYELCARRLRNGGGEGFSLAHWRLAGVGAEMIRRDTLDAFVSAVERSGFDRRAFVPSYGMAEVGLAISFSTQGTGVVVDRVDARPAEKSRLARSATDNADPNATREFVDCGPALPGIDVEVRAADGRKLSDRRIGTLWVKTASVMEGYLDDPIATSEVLAPNGWLNTGDLGYLVDGHVFVTGREKDIIIVNGRNLWPQDLEYVAERQDGVRTGDAMAFSLVGADRREEVVMLLQCREQDAEKRDALAANLRAQIRTEFGVDCRIELVDPHALPRTSSGKPSRSKARQKYLSSLAAESPSAIRASAASVG